MKVRQFKIQRKLLITLLLWAVTGLGTATSQEKSVLLLPIAVEGDYRPITTERLNQQVLQELDRTGVRVVAGLKDDATPADVKAARLLAKDRGTDYVAWGEIEFAHKYKSLPSGPVGSAGSESSPFRFQTTSRVLYQVRVSSNCKLTLIPADEGKRVVLADSFLPHLHSATTGTVPGSEAHRKVESRLAGWCIKTLVSHLKEAVD